MSTIHGRLSRQAAVRLQAGELILRGFDNDEIIDILDVSLSSLKRWRPKVESEGLHVLARKSGSGRSSELSTKQRDELTAIIQQGAVAAGYQTDRWTSRIVADLIRNKWGVTYCLSNVRKILAGLGLSYQKPDVKSTKHSQAVVDHWRRYIWPRIKKKRTKTISR
jgi:putative transposase